MTYNNREHECSCPANPMYQLFEMLYGPQVAREIFHDEHGKCTAEKKMDVEIANENTKECANKTKEEVSKVARHTPTRNNRFPYGATNVMLDCHQNYVISIMLPGFKKEDISVSYSERTLTVLATAKQVVGECECGECTCKMLKEEFRGAESIKRELTLSNPDYKQAKMELANGVLTITVPTKKAETNTLSFD